MGEDMVKGMRAISWILSRAFRLISKLFRMSCLGLKQIVVILKKSRNE